MLISPRRSSPVFVALVAVAAIIALPAPAAAQDLDEGPPNGDPFDQRFATGEAAVERLGQDLAEVAEAAGLDAGQLVALLESDTTLTVDPNGHLRYLEPVAPTASGDDDGEGEDDAPTADQATPADQTEIDDAFALASLPGAATTIVLDFDGHVTTDTDWNAIVDGEPIATGPYDLDGDPATWSIEELQVVRDTWAVVAEDFAPWEVNVTTAEPADPADLTNEGAGDARRGARVVVTPDDWSSCGCGAQAPVGSFDEPGGEPAYVFHAGFREVSEGSAHVLGHLFGLHHASGPDETVRYAGHESLDGPDWAPIMGASAGRALGQWSAQEYVGAGSIDQDEVAIISSADEGTGLALLTDDHGGIDDPTPLNGPSPVVDGLVGTRDDTDAFSFTTTGGRAELSVAVAEVGPNLDAALILLDEAGNELVDDDPAERLSASIDVELPAGGYTVVVDGVGVGLPFLDPPTGYTDTGSLGRYTLTGAIEGAPPDDVEPPEAPEGLLALAFDGIVVLGWAPNGDADLGGYVVTRTTSSGEEGEEADVAADVAVLDADRNGHEDLSPPTGESRYAVVAVDVFGNRSTPSNEASVVILASEELPGETDVEDGDEDNGDEELPDEPGAVADETDDNETDDNETDDNETDPTEDGDATDSEAEPTIEEEVGPTVEEVERETFVYGAIAGQVDAIAEADGVTQRITETLSGGAERARHDRLDHRWSFPPAEGNQELRVAAEVESDAGDADEGFVIGWSLDRIDWTPLVTILPGESIDERFDIGAPEDTVHVRVRDTDRTPRQQSPDSVLIDLLQVIGDGLPVEPEPEPSEVEVEVDHHFQGLGDGERAVVVTGSAVDDTGQPVAGASIMVKVDGDVAEVLTLTTGRDGTADEQTEGAALRPEVEVCVVEVEAEGLVWAPRSEDCPAPTVDPPPDDPGDDETTDPAEPTVTDQDGELGEASQADETTDQDQDGDQDQDDEATDSDKASGQDQDGEPDEVSDQDDDGEPGSEGATGPQ